MVEQDEIKKQIDHERIENARIGYQVAVNIWWSDVQLVWSKFNAMLVANGIIIASIGWSLTRSTMSSVPSCMSFFSIGMPIFGIILCLLWFLSTRRSFQYHKYWVYSVRELEEQYLGNSVKTISRGRKFADGEPIIEFRVGRKKKPLKMGYLGRLRVEWGSYAIISLFFAVYLVILILNALD